MSTEQEELYREYDLLGEEDEVIKCGYCGSIEPSVRNEEGWLCCPNCQGV